MRHLLPFALAAVSVLSFAGCAGPLIANPPKPYALAQTGGLNCARFAESGDKKIQIYCGTWRHAKVTVSDAASNCRLLLDKSGDGVESSCRDAAQWDQYDTLAVSAGVTCRWRSMTRQTKEQLQAPKPQLQEVCLTASNWTKVDDAERQAPRRRAVDGSFGSPWGGGGAGSGSQDSYATSYGAFPAGGAIGQ